MEWEGTGTFGHVDHIGVIVEDMEKAVRYYESLGIGPFEERKGPGATERTLYGQPGGDMRLRVSNASMGSVRIELIQPVCGKSVQADYLATHGEGINHLGFIVKDCQATVRRLREQGFRVVAGGKIPGGGEFAYFDTDKTGGIVFEVVQPPPPPTPEGSSG
jgi:4-hydroxyphenylpyruvate dioxygenase-like putative hemolysin